MAKRKTGKLISGSRTKYEPNQRERAAMQGFHARNEAENTPALTLRDGSLINNHGDHAVGQLMIMEQIGTCDPNMYAGVLQQLAVAYSRKGRLDLIDANFALSVVKAIKPQDALELMLAAQMAAVHIASMRAAQRLANSELVIQADQAERMFNRLARTYAAQMEAFKKYRSAPDTNVTVQKVSVNGGGQAIVGNVIQAAPAPEPAPTDDASLAPAERRERPMLPDARAG